MKKIFIITCGAVLYLLSCTPKTNIQFSSTCIEKQVIKYILEKGYKGKKRKDINTLYISSRLYHFEVTTTHLHEKCLSCNLQLQDEKMIKSLLETNIPYNIELETWKAEASEQKYQSGIHYIFSPIICTSNKNVHYITYRRSDDESFSVSLVKIRTKGGKITALDEIDGLIIFF